MLLIIGVVVVVVILISMSSCCMNSSKVKENFTFRKKLAKRPARLPTNTTTTPYLTTTTTPYLTTTTPYTTPPPLPPYFETTPYLTTTTPPLTTTTPYLTTTPVGSSPKSAKQVSIAIFQKNVVALALNGSGELYSFGRSRFTPPTVQFKQFQVMASTVVGVTKNGDIIMARVPIDTNATWEWTKLPVDKDVKFSYVHIDSRGTGVWAIGADNKIHYIFFSEDPTNNTKPKSGGPQPGTVIGSIDPKVGVLTSITLKGAGTQSGGILCTNANQDVYSLKSTSATDLTVIGPIGTGYVKIISDGLFAIAINNQGTLYLSTGNEWNAIKTMEGCQDISSSSGIMMMVGFSGAIYTSDAISTNPRWFKQ